MVTAAWAQAMDDSRVMFIMVLSCQYLHGGHYFISGHLGEWNLGSTLPQNRASLNGMGVALVFIWLRQLHCPVLAIQRLRLMGGRYIMHFVVETEEEFQLGSC